MLIAVEKEMAVQIKTKKIIDRLAATSKELTLLLLV